MMIDRSNSSQQVGARLIVNPLVSISTSAHFMCSEKSAADCFKATINQQPSTSAFDLRSEDMSDQIPEDQSLNIRLWSKDAKQQGTIFRKKPSAFKRNLFQVKPVLSYCRPKEYSPEESFDKSGISATEKRLQGEIKPLKSSFKIKKVCSSDRHLMASIEGGGNPPLEMRSSIFSSSTDRQTVGPGFKESGDHNFLSNEMTTKTENNQHHRSVSRQLENLERPSSYDPAALLLGSNQTNRIHSFRDYQLMQKKASNNEQQKSILLIKQASASDQRSNLVSEVSSERTHKRVSFSKDKVVLVYRC